MNPIKEETYHYTSWAELKGERMIVTVECLCGYIASWNTEISWFFECPDRGRKWTTNSKGTISQMSLPSKETK
jgi:hypothetical protein